MRVLSEDDPPLLFCCCAELTCVGSSGLWTDLSILFRGGYRLAKVPEKKVNSNTLNF